MELLGSFLILILIVLLSACTITNLNDNYVQTVSSWRWAKESSLLQSWGRPTQITKLPNGNKVFIYHKERYKNYPAASVTSQVAAVSIPGGRNLAIVPTYNQSPPEASYLAECTTLFEIDPRQIIVDVRASGNNCTGDEGFRLSKSNPHPIMQLPPKKP